MKKSAWREGEEQIRQRGKLLIKARKLGIKLDITQSSPWSKGQATCRAK